MSWQILRADARALPLTDASVDLIVTSPPYWGLRSYRDGGEHYDGQVGSEVTPAEYVDELVGMVDGEWRRVLKRSGSLFLNLGDKYAGSGGAGTTSGLGATPSAERGSERVFPKGLNSARPKSLLGLPWRIALALIDRGWILRAEIIWSKPNGLPESVKDRVRRSHEQVFHFTREPRYFSAVDEIRETHAYPAQLTDLSKLGPARSIPGQPDHGGAVGLVGVRHNNIPGALNPLGRLPGSVWTIPTSPLIIPDNAKQHFGLPDHFAAYPPELVRRIVLGWSPRGVCTVCGEPRRTVTGRPCERCGAPIPTQGKECPACGHRRDWRAERQTSDELKATEWDKPGAAVPRRQPKSNTTRLIGEACACPTPDADTTPGVVLDPMCGPGTTVGVAHKLGRHGIGVDLSADYCRLAEWRIDHSGHFDQAEDRSWQERQLTLEG